MMKKIGLLTLMLCGLTQAVEIGKPAPDFTGKSYDGKSHKLSEYKGKFVVLEWHNQGCPFVKKHYESNNMQKLQSEWTGKGVAWITIISSPPGKEGYVTADQERKYLSEKKSTPTVVLADPEGALGRLYGAKTTPHMFIIDKSGTLIYNGAIDDKASSDQEDVAGAKNYVQAALTEATAGKRVTIASTAPYGCSIKYVASNK
jgi:peroxiredoxin